MSSFSKNLAFILGLFELFLAAPQFYFNSSEKIIADHRLLPDEISQIWSLKVVYITCILYLGLQRLTYSFIKEKNVFAWLTLVLTHVIEIGFWWTLSLQSHFNVNNLSLSEILFDAISFKLPSSKHSFTVLIIVPIITLFFIVQGPGADIQASQKKNE